MRFTATRPLVTPAPEIATITLFSGTHLAAEFSSAGWMIFISVSTMSACSELPESSAMECHRRSTPVGWREACRRGDLRADLAESRVNSFVGGEGEQVRAYDRVLTPSGFQLRFQLRFQRLERVKILTISRCTSSGGTGTLILAKRFAEIRRTFVPVDVTGASVGWNCESERSRPRTSDRVVSLGDRRPCRPVTSLVTEPRGRLAAVSRFSLVVVR